MPIPIYQPGEKPIEYLNQLLQQRPDREQQYQGALTQLKQASTQRSPEAEDAAQWGALAQGFAAPAPNFWQSLANAGAMKAQAVQKIEADRLTHQRELAKLQLEQAGKLLGQEDLLTRALAGRSLGATAGSGVVTRQSQDGTIIVLDKATGQEVKRYDPNESTMFKTFYTQFLEQSKSLDTEDPEVRLAWASQKAMDAVSQARAAAGNRATAPGSPNMRAPLPATVAAPAAAEEPSVGVIPPAVQADRDAARGQLVTDELTTAQAELKRLEQMRDVVDPASKQRAGLNEELIAKRQQVAALQQETGGLRFRAPQTEAEKTAYGTQTGKHYADMAVDIQKTGTAARDVLGKLDMMENLYTKHGEAIPAGEWGPYAASLKSALTTFGVKLEGTGPTDVAKALSTEQALKSRTADGTNLLPGAMSNYEDRLLQSMAPGLGMTHEGRLLQLQVAKAQLNMRMELAEAAQAYIMKHGRLDAGWDPVASKIAAKNPLLSDDGIRLIERRAKAALALAGRK